MSCTGTSNVHYTNEFTNPAQTRWNEVILDRKLNTADGLAEA